MQKFIAWLKSKNFNSHTIVVAGVGLAGLVVTDQSVRDYLISTFAAHPKIITGIFTAAGVILKYSQSNKPRETWTEEQRKQNLDKDVK